MHIALIRQYFDQSAGGAEKYAVQLAQGLRDRGHRISLVSARVNRSDAEGMEVVKCSRGKWAGPWRHLAFAKSSGQRAAGLNADAVVALARAYPADFFRLGDPLHWTWMRLKYPDPRRRAWAEKQPRHRALLKVEEKLLGPSGAKQLIANSELVRRQVIHAYGVEPERIQVFRNPVDTTRFHPNCESLGVAFRRELDIPPDAIVVLFSGMEFRRKGLIQAAEAFIRLVHQSEDSAEQLRFLVVGKGDAGEARKAFSAAGIEHKLLVRPPTSEIEKFYAASNVFVLPTLFDPSANAVSESLACGTAVVTTRSNGASELIRSGINGEVISDREDKDALANAIASILATERIQRSRQYVALAQQLPDWDQHVQLWEEAIRSHVQQQSRAKLFASPSVPASPAYAQTGEWLIATNESKLARSLVWRSGVDWPEECFEPSEQLRVRAPEKCVRARYKVRGEQPAGDRHFTPAGALFVETHGFQEDAVAGMAAFECAFDCMRQNIPAVYPIAAGSDGTRSFSVLTHAPGAPLLQFMRRYAGANDRTSRRVFKEVSSRLAELLAHLHQSGWRHGSIDAHSFFASLNIRGEIHLCLSGLFSAWSTQDVASSSHASEGIAADLAALNVCIPLDLVSRQDRLRFLRRYLHSLGAELDRRDLLKDVDRLSRLFHVKIAEQVIAPEVEERSAAADPVDSEEGLRQILAPATLDDIDEV